MPSAINATLDTSTMELPLSVGVWSAIVTWSAAGVVGNDKKLHVATVTLGGGDIVEVRDNERWDADTEAWISEPGTVGVLGDFGIDTVTTADIETAINATSALCQVTTVDPSGGDLDDPAGEWTGTFSGGVNAGFASAEGYARMMMALLPPGRVWTFIGSVIEKLFLACADELARLDIRVNDLLAESVATSAVETLPDYESELGLDSTGTDEERQARVVARLVARQRYRPVDFQTALAPLFGQAAEDIAIIERDRTDAIAMDDDREIFRFFAYRDPTEPGEYFIDSAQDLIDQIKPSHTLGYAIESIDFLCDDPYSLCDRDILGA